MELINAIVAALAVGAAAGLEATSTQAMKDAYTGLKLLLRRKYAHVSLTELEEKPESSERRKVVGEGLAAAGAFQDQEFLHQAKIMMEAIQHTPETAASIGVDLEHIKGAALRIGDVVASGSGVKLRHGEFTDNIEISGIRAGQSESHLSKKG